MKTCTRSTQCPECAFWEVKADPDEPLVVSKYTKLLEASLDRPLLQKDNLKKLFEFMRKDTFHITDEEFVAIWNNFQVLCNRKDPA